MDTSLDTIEERNAKLMSAVFSRPSKEMIDSLDPESSLNPANSTNDVEPSAPNLDHTAEPAERNSQGLDYLNDNYTVDPACILLQLYPFPIFKENLYSPIPIPENNSTNRAFNILDRTPSVDLHKIGVIYVSKNQTTEVEVLGNTKGSMFYQKFLESLGDAFPLIHESDIYSGGLDTSQDKIDGAFALCYIPDQRLCQVIFHVTTMMPNIPGDPQRTTKKRHIGNDFVNIVWNEGGHPFNFDTIPGQFNLFQVVIELVEGDHFETALFRISTKCGEMVAFYDTITDIVSGKHLGLFVRQICIYCNMVALSTTRFAASPTLERLRQIKRIKDKLPPASENSLDFTKLVI
jgi:hypothetical protein